MNILDEIFAHTRQVVAERQRTLPLESIRREAEQSAPALDFVASLRKIREERSSPALIAEIKRASPSKGLLVQDFDPLRLAQIYRQNGAAAISVLTEERYFQGSLEILRQVARQEPAIPRLRKDFVCDPYQVYEARAAGADAVLLIAAYLEPGCLRDLHALVRSLGMAPLVEVHSQAELERALTCQPVLVGINNRDLRDFTVRLETTLALRPLVPPEVCLVAESGIHTPADVARLGAAGVDAILVGEALVTAGNIADKVRSLSGKEME